MKALILVGGYGTRLRPLTLSVPKPLINFCNKSIVEHQVKALVKAGVNHVILAVAYQPSTMMEALTQLESKFKIKITCSREYEPLGTAGPIRLAEKLLMDTEDDDSDSFFVCNSDVICQFPLKAMLDFHARHGGEGTLLTTRVDNPSMFGVILADDTGKIQQFVEKPQSFVGDRINAGLYLLRKTVVRRIEPRPTSIETEIFPAIARDGQLFCMPLEGYWADIGKPKDFLNGMSLHLAALADDDAKSQGSNDPEDQLSKDECVRGNVLIASSASVGPGSVIGPDVTIGPDCVVGSGVRIKNAALMTGVVVKDCSWIEGAILGWQSTVGKWVRIEGLTVVGEDVQLRDECYVNGAFVLPHKAISESIHEPGTIIM